MTKDRNGITNALKDMEAKMAMRGRHNAVPMLTLDERKQFCEITGLDYFVMLQIEDGLLAGAHNANVTKRNMGLDQAFATERLYAFRKAVRDRIAPAAPQAEDKPVDLMGLDYLLAKG
jgi:hypothetical protein